MHSSKQNFRQPAKGSEEGVFKLLRDKLFLNHYLKINVPVFIYQMGKVASKSVYRSLCHQYPGIVLHAHYFNPNHTDWRIRRLYHWAIVKMMPLNVISLTREPIGRNLSA